MIARLDSVSKQYGTKNAVDSLSLVIAPGTIFGGAGAKRRG